MFKIFHRYRLTKHYCNFFCVSGVVDMEKDYPELKDYCDKLSKEVPNYAKANGDGVAKFGGWCPEKVKKAVEKVTAA